jgi:2-polyprenyl-3-methyl-5-hydroxy-6-metoxy-1,4-benzoquinol methylase
MVMSDTRYDRDICLDRGDSSAKIIAKIHPRSVVLDVGCGPGILGSYLISKLGCTVDGIDLSEEFCQRAGESYRNVWRLDVQNANLGDAIADRTYDRIICADVLEHIPEPELLLDRLSGFLNDQGRILISIPNVGYAGLLAELFCGKFDYRETGLLDRTHLRFFTRSSLIQMLTRNGLRIFSFEASILDIAGTEFDSSILQQMEPSLFNAVLARPDALSYQFIVEAAPGSTESNSYFLEAEVQEKGLKAISGYDHSLDFAMKQIAALEDTLARKSREYKTHVTQLEELLSKQNAEVELRGQELERKRSQLNDVRAKLEWLQRDLDWKNEELRVQRELTEKYSVDKDKIENILRGVYASKSWRIMQGLRALLRPNQ